MTALLVSEIEDLDISERIEPIVASVLGSGVVGAVPGLGTVAVNILTNSLIEGTANAFLTLRIGSVTRQYCGALTRLDKRLVRRSATVAAAALLGAIVRESAGVVSKAILKAAGDVGTRGAAAAKDGLAKGLQRTRGANRTVIGALFQIRYNVAILLTQNGSHLMPHLLMFTRAGGCRIRPRPALSG